MTIVSGLLRVSRHSEGAYIHFAAFHIFFFFWLLSLDLVVLVGDDVIVAFICSLSTAICKQIIVVIDIIKPIFWGFKVV